MFIINQLKLVD